MSSYVNVHLSDVNEIEPTANRIISLSSPRYDLKIGRGSQSEQGLRPHDSNAWFTARVMSRDHAVLRADPETRKMTIEDAGSMHGTYIEDARLEPGNPMTVHDNTIIRFGTEIVRGELTYYPLELQLNYAWVDKSVRPEITPAHQNSFSFNYSDEEENEDDVRFIYESPVLREKGPSRQSRTFSVPESEDSDSSRRIDDSQEESAVSSAVGSPETKNTKDEVALRAPVHVTLPEKVTTIHAVKPGSSVQHALNLTDDEEEHSQQHNFNIKLRGGLIADDAENDEDNEDDSDEDYEDDAADEDEGDEHEDDQDDEDDENQDVNEGATVSEEGLDLFECNDEAEIEGQPTVDIQSRAANASIREPSPSDAALPKSWISSTTSSAPTVMDQSSLGLLYHSSYPSGMSYPSDHAANYSANVHWSANNNNSHGMFGSYEHPYIQQLSMNASSPWQLLSSCSRDAGEPVITAKQYTPNTSSKVSINNIIDEVQSEIPTVDTGLTRKRKADEISYTSPHNETSSCDNAREAPQAEAGAKIAATRHPAKEYIEILRERDEARAARQSHALSLSAANVGSKTEEDANASSVAAVPSEEEHAHEERPRKIVKAKHEARGNSIFKYAAAAMAGVTVGAVGTVFGLAALPAEYFA